MKLNIQGITGKSFVLFSPTDDERVVAELELIRRVMKNILGAKPYQFGVAANGPDIIVITATSVGLVQRVASIYPNSLIYTIDALQKYLTSHSIDLKMLMFAVNDNCTAAYYNKEQKNHEDKSSGGQNNTGEIKELTSEVFGKLIYTLVGYCGVQQIILCRLQMSRQHGPLLQILDRFGVFNSSARLAEWLDNHDGQPRFYWDLDSAVEELKKSLKSDQDMADEVSAKQQRREDFLSNFIRDWKKTR